LSQAGERLEGARTALRAGFGWLAVGAAYSAMLYAARAALSEEDRYAKSHSGVWTLVRKEFVQTARFEDELAAAAQRAQGLREAADYDAARVSDEQAAAVLADAERFVAAVRSLLEG
jgi:uncharacterized protein (UPF0332 family)